MAGEERKGSILGALGWREARWGSGKEMKARNAPRVSTRTLFTTSIINELKNGVHSYPSPIPQPSPPLGTSGVEPPAPRTSSSSTSDHPPSSPKQPPPSSERTTGSSVRPPPTRLRRFLRRLGLFIAVLAFFSSVYGLLAAYFPALRYPIIGLVRCTRVAIAVFGAILDYKLLFRKTWAEDTEEGRKQRHEDYEATHLSAAMRILAVLRKNGGIYVKLGQHLSSIQLIPTAWSTTMRPLQDQCRPTPYDEMDEMFRKDVGQGIEDLFEDFEREPIGVASLAQVHRATDRKTGMRVAVKVMHPDLEEYCEVDMVTAIVMLNVVKWVFPTFEFTWLGEEMQENLPKEMNFRHEAAMAARCRADFAPLRNTALRIPEVLWAKERVLVMEYIQGARVDDLEYLAEHRIDRNRVSQELSRIFSQMIYINGFFHADPHAGNLLIRPSPEDSKSPFRFEIVLLDHGLYFDMPEDLRVNYAHLWLSLIKSATPEVSAERRHYAHLVGNIDPSHYAIFESAITGRAGMDGAWDDESAEDFEPGKGNFRRAGSLLDMAVQTREEQHKIREAVVESGMVTSIFEILRTVPRRLLMVLKVNDLTRSLDASLKTTHSPIRIWLIVARFCGVAVWQDEKVKMGVEIGERGMSFRIMRRWVGGWLEYQKWYNGLRLVEWGMDTYAGYLKLRLWLHGLRKGGLQGARRLAAGLDTIAA